MTTKQGNGVPNCLSLMINDSDSLTHVSAEIHEMRQRKLKGGRQKIVNLILASYRKKKQHVCINSINISSAQNRFLIVKIDKREMVNNDKKRQKMKKGIGNGIESG